MERLITRFSSQEFEMTSLYPEDWKALLERAMVDDDLYETLVR